ncbi:MAG: hypothetical protein UT55_C0053G0006 [Candidatus Peregrinibacteria bacterium GW2011_GWE2_39_6]|nr:MAG: hypothetical protein UT36_C0006G0062 [Candidatus Peregrinibacteria bacterium GW2011_GWF2_39_17]KKR24827.1 MAG: hypothetical protein UT55_C0053G0006 [Candidatus Peregrinibacteria bacterium GW2011_GWE2_39_6]HCW32776.1 hypothetical protein [Candidatus Peregrinibacteria bacterium]
MYSLKEIGESGFLDASPEQPLMQKVVQDMYALLEDIATINHDVVSLSEASSNSSWSWNAPDKRRISFIKGNPRDKKSTLPLYELTRQSANSTGWENIKRAISTFGLPQQIALSEIAEICLLIANNSEFDQNLQIRARDIFNYIVNKPYAELQETAVLQRERTEVLKRRATTAILVGEVLLRSLDDLRMEAYYLEKKIQILGISLGIILTIIATDSRKGHQFIDKDLPIIVSAIRAKAEDFGAKLKNLVDKNIPDK